ncbi:hypothetical protein CCC_02016 [Paramagnetospirillum magnetotacticum MS-1]|uniref:STAS domain-containing protein n=1 Tax=Paramagnetospirillum magnetotacticum MS-1 TaxID=272627 RepID=A0A0C2V0E4_PARME|nr:STAS domain-containing protein [Paramagnetospirillum magnetotacticum]KIL98566.1 hypothetical protein CCC_02016 [Paramagnetospirillum magnetotacticum MS-1]
MPLNHTLSRNGNVLTIKLSGDFSFSENMAFRTVVDAVVSSGASSVEVDLTGIGSLDSAALSMLILLRERLAKAGGTLTLVKPPPQVDRILEVVDFGKLFTIVR